MDVIIYHRLICKNHYNSGLLILIHRGSYMGAHVLLNLLKESGKEIKCEAC